PALQRFFNVDPARPGLTSLVLGRTTLAEALVKVPLGRPAGTTVPSADEPHANGNGNGAGPVLNGAPRATPGGRLYVLPAGLVPPHPGEFITSPRLDQLLRELAEHNYI